MSNWHKYVLLCTQPTHQEQLHLALDSREQLQLSHLPLQLHCSEQGHLNRTKR